MVILNATTPGTRLYGHLTIRRLKNGSTYDDCFNHVVILRSILRLLVVMYLNDHLYVMNDDRHYSDFLIMIRTMMLHLDALTGTS